MRTCILLATWLSNFISIAMACPEPANLISTAEQALVDLRITALPFIQEELEAAWSCSPRASPEDLSRAWLMGAAYLHLQGQHETAILAWRAASTISPETWNPRLGESLRKEYLSALQVPAEAQGTLDLSEDLPRKLQLYLDGSPTSLPLTTAPGPHLVQTIDRRGQTHAARLIQLAPSESLILDLGHFSSAPGRQRSHWRLAVSGSVAGLAAGSALLALSQNSAMRQAETQTLLDDAYLRQKRLAMTSYGLGGLAIAGAATWVFF